MLPPTCFTVQMVPGFLQTWRMLFRPKISVLGFIRPENLNHHGLRHFRGLLANSKRAGICFFLWSCFRLATTIKAWLVERCRDGCPSGSFSHLHRGTLELFQSNHHNWSPTWPRPFSPNCSVPSSRKSLGGSKLLPFKNDAGHCVLWDIQCCRHVWVPFPRSVPRHNPVSELYGQFLRPHGLVFALTCNVNTGTLYRQVGAFPNHVHSIEFTTSGLQSSFRNISRMINGNRCTLAQLQVS